MFYLFLALLFTLYSSQEITIPLLKQYTVYSYAASCRDGLKNWTCYWCNTNQLPSLPPVKVALVFQSGPGTKGIYGYVGTTQNKVIVAFRGSSTYQNWFKDFQFKQVAYQGAPSGAQVHYGFYTAYQSVQSQIRGAVQTLLRANPSYTVALTGHSLGAALSVICATDLILQNIITPARTTLINIGQPRVGNQKFAQFFNGFNLNVVARVVNLKDPVPHLPLKAMNYYHERTEYWFPKNTSTFVKCDGTGEDPHCSDSVKLFNPHDHVTYLGFQVNEGNTHGCGSDY